jgi:type VI secretion system secreted protein Hcp
LYTESQRVHTNILGWVSAFGYIPCPPGFGIVHNTKKGIAMKKTLFAILAGIVLASASNTYMEIDGIPGSVTVAGREGTVEVLNLNHRVYLPTDRDDGSITGTRKHDALEILKVIDKSSPLLMQRVCTGESIAKVTIKVYQISDAGEEIPFYQIELTKVKIASVQTSTSALDGEPLTLEKVTIRYEKISWTYLDGNLMHADEWNSR